MRRYPSPNPSPQGGGARAAGFILPPSLTLPRPTSPSGLRRAGKGGGEALRREVKFAHVALSDVEADGSFHGYASLFGETDLNRDLVLPGAFQKSIAKRGAAGIRMLFQHDPAAPIGVWREVREDSRGLFVSGRLMREVAKAREVLALMRAGAIDGLSIGFRTVRGRTDAKSGVRHLIEVDLWEVSVVTFPMLPAARVSAVKGIGNDRELSHMMRRAALAMRVLSLPPCGGGLGRG
jgi:HK97 family phage prohead protease